MSDEIQRWDVLVVPGKPSFRIADHGLKAVLRYLALSQLMVEREHITGDGWVELYLAPDMFAHHVFVEGNVPEVAPVFEEAVLRFGTAPTGLAYGDPGREVWVYLEIIGAIYERVGEDFSDRLHQILYLHPKCYCRPHAPVPRTQGEVEAPLEHMAVRRAAVTVEDAD